MHSYNAHSRSRQPQVDQPPAAGSSSSTASCSSSAEEPTRTFRYIRGWRGYLPVEPGRPTSKPSDPDAWKYSGNKYGPAINHPSVVEIPYMRVGAPLWNPYISYMPKIPPGTPAFDPDTLEPEARESYDRIQAIFDSTRAERERTHRELGGTKRSHIVSPIPAEQQVGSNVDVPACKPPPEILQIIFLHVLEDGDQDVFESLHPLVSRKCSENPLLLGQVCSSWRLAALGEPKLWRRMVIINPTRRHAYMAAIWLERAKNYPLELILEEGLGMNADSAWAAEKITRLFGSRRRYWKNVHFEIRAPNLQGLGYPLEHEPSFKYLESFSVFLIDFFLDITFERPNDELFGLWRKFSECPTLRRLHWRGPSRRILQVTRRSWNNLQDVSFDFPLTQEECFDMLMRCPNLEIVAPLRLSSVSAARLSSERIICAKLHTLNVSSSVDTESLFASITLPALRDLTLRNTANEGVARNIAQLKEFLSRSECPLEAFSLIDPLMGENTLTSLLRHPCFGDLLSLSIATSITDILIHFLTLGGPPGIGGFLPSLELLHLSGCDTTDGTLTRMILSRLPQGQGGGLKKLSVFKAMGTSYGLTDASTLRRVFQEGMQGSHN
ncbi:hypothetical protein CVT26_008903 [Gymnopilus dilepis]|uniref:Uncharacterized protein n=1 Tax=Gymnopilus dilepis TaxID=231916 RepID=A0A409YAV2_9AGAR|nr:hypothetical protein CVT26_008903 [Gymnopilus dilepis]